GARLDPPQSAPVDLHVVLARGALRCLLRVAQHRGEHAGVQRALVERDLAHARNRGDYLWLDVDNADGADDAGARLRVPPRDVAAFERRLRGCEECVAAHRNGRRSGVRRLAGEAKHVTLDAEGTEHDAGWFVHRLEDRSLLDVELEIRAGIDRLQLAMRV